MISTSTSKDCASGSIQRMAGQGCRRGRYFWLLLIGYFEGLDAERAIAWRAADSFTLREFLGLVLPEAPPDHSTISRTRRLIDLETHEAVFTWILQRLADTGLVKGKTVGMTRRRWKRMPRCAASCGGTPVRATRPS
jgi:transposase